MNMHFGIIKNFLIAILFLKPLFSWAGFSNYNSVLIGERAAGMGGTYTAFSYDPSGCAFYNPSTISRMEGATLSAAVNVYYKSDTQFGEVEEIQSAALRVNRGTIVPIPASSGTVYSFGNFALALSIVFPDFDSYTGEIKSSPEVISYMNLLDQSLWVGGSLGINITEEDSLGLTMYYSSRTFTRSASNQLTTGGITSLTNEEKHFSQNSLIYIIGYYRQLTKNFSFGTSLRLPSIPISGQGSYFRSTIDTTGNIDSINIKDIGAETRVPSRWNIGIGYTEKNHFTLGIDVSYSGRESYQDMKYDQAGERIRHQETWNFSIGGEYYIRPWAAWRMGLFSNFSSHPDISDDTTFRTGDHIDMWGFSSNIALFTTGKSTVTLGGYYTGGKGKSIQLVGDQLNTIPKSQQIFSFLVGTSFQF